MKKIFLEADQRNEKAIVRYKRFVGVAFRKKANYFKHVKVFNQYTREWEEELVNLVVEKWKGNIAIVNIRGI